MKLKADISKYCPTRTRCLDWMKRSVAFAEARTWKQETPRNTMRPRTMPMKIPKITAIRKSSSFSTLLPVAFLLSFPPEGFVTFEERLDRSLSTVPLGNINIRPCNTCQIQFKTSTQKNSKGRIFACSVWFAHKKYLTRNRSKVDDRASGIQSRLKTPILAKTV